MGIPILSEIFGAVKDLASEVIVDKDKKNEILLKIKELEDNADQRLHDELMGQIEINKIEAANTNVFVAGWRPAIGWVGASALAYSYILQPFIGLWMKVPALDLNGLYNIVIAMLGVGAMRTYEKVKNVTDTKAIKD